MEIVDSVDKICKAYIESNWKSLTKTYLTQEVADKIKNAKTKMGGTLAHCIIGGYLEPTSSIGFMASDVEAYTLFAALSDNIIKDYHKFAMDKPISHPKKDFGDLNDLPFGDLDPGRKYIVSTRVRVGRSAQGFAWSPLISKTARNDIEAKAKIAFKTLPAEYKGTYHPLKGMSKAVEKQLIDDHFLFGNDDKYNVVTGVYRDWPEGRGIYFNKNKTFLVWVNEEDHLRIISMQEFGDLGAVYKRLVQGINHVEKTIPFARSDRLGFLTFCPTNLGTSLRASVHARIPKLAANEEMFKDICATYNIQPRGMGGEHTASVGGVYDLSNKRRLGITEVQAVKEMADGVKAILAKEASLP